MTGTRRVAVKFTANFEANLEAIESWLVEAGFPQGYDRLLDEIGETIIPNLERFPAMGRPFASRRPDSVEAVSRHEKLQARLAGLGQGGDIREYVIEDYLVLYALIGESVYLLSIRHHKQLSFDFTHLWLDRNQQ
ncbi:MAG: type II toxin-antitoxin system RelE/ParE family toxin [Zoogloea sp.]|nr:type II toxin-antitoxin system RelE/ParE family toxin [Zoogloea sp.]